MGADIVHQIRRARRSAVRLVGEQLQHRDDVGSETNWQRGAGFQAKLSGGLATERQQRDKLLLGRSPTAASPSAYTRPGRLWSAREVVPFGGLMERPHAFVNDMADDGEMTFESFRSGRYT